MLARSEREAVRSAFSQPIGRHFGDGAKLKLGDELHRRLRSIFLKSQIRMVPIASDKTECAGHPEFSAERKPIGTRSTYEKDGPERGTLAAAEGNRKRLSTNLWSG
jgi:hypothetical protein